MLRKRRHLLLTIIPICFKMLDFFRSCTVLITDGPNPLTSLTYYHSAHYVENIQRTPVPQIAKADIVDSIGAGDSFVAGYLYGRMIGNSNKDCVQSGVRPKVKNLNIN